MSSTNKEYFGIIRKAIENNKLAVFVGSAVSFDSNLPSWSKLIQEMKGSLGYTKGNDYLKIAELYYRQFGRHSYYEKISNFFPVNSKPNKVHDLIVALKPQHIITTNWDNLLDKSLSEKGDLYFPVATDHELASSPISKLLIKMHGDIVHRNIVFKESDYNSYADNFPLIENFIKSIFSTHLVIFIGYSISDHNLNQILSWVRNRTVESPPIFTILTDNTIETAELDYLKSKGVFAILSDSVNDADKEKYRKLSEKSIKVAKVIAEINEGEKYSTLEFLNRIEKDIDVWSVVYPPSFVQMIKDLMHITKINKVYFDSSIRSIVYYIDGEFSGDRNSYRNLRKVLKRIMNKLPIKQIKFYLDNDRFIRIVNGKNFDFVDEYILFDFYKIYKRISFTKIGLSQDLDEEYQYAFDSYFLSNLIPAREAFVSLSVLYFSRSQFIKSLICAFNKKQLCFGVFNIEQYEEISEIMMEERLSKNDNISELIDKFPKSLFGRQKPLLKGLDENNSFLLLIFKIVSDLARRIDNDLEKSKNGTLIGRKSVIDIQNYIYCMILFFNKNKIVAVHDSGYKTILKIAFESVLKISSYKNIFTLDKIFSYSAILSYKDRDLNEFLSFVLKNECYMMADSETFSYLMKVLDNSLLSISSLNLAYQQKYAFNVWSNVIIILSYIKHNKNQLGEISEKLHDAIKIGKVMDFSRSINIFLVNQHNKYKSMIPVDSLDKLFRDQIINIDLRRQVSVHENGKLFNNLANLIKNSSESVVFGDDSEILNFINAISIKPFSERLSSIDEFVFSILSLSTGNLKNTINKMLKSTFKESKQNEFTLNSVVFGLNLHIIGLLNVNDIAYVLNKLNVLVANDLQRRRYSSAYLAIDKQLAVINESVLEKFVSTVEKVSELAERYRNFFDMNDGE